MNLLIIAPADRPLSPAQRKFNQLVRKIEQARAELLAWQDMVPAFAQAHAQRARPLLADIAACRRQLASRLDTLLAAGKWSKTERRTMREILCDVVAGLIDNESGDAAELAELKALFDQHADVDFDTENRASIAAMKGLFEAMSGMDLGDEAFESEETMMQRARERWHAEAAAQESAEAPAAARREPRKTAAQRRRESEAQEASQSVREVYRKLVSALHPDRASDEADRTARTAQMQRVNRAYDAKDLLALFALQLEIEQVDAAHLAQASAERARHYNQVLAAQLAELQAEAQARQVAFVMDYGIELGLDPYLPVKPQQLGKLLDRAVAELRGDLAEANRDLRRLDDPAAAKRWLKRVHREQQAFDDELF